MAQATNSQLDFLRPFLRADATFLEIGPGDCALSFAVAELVKRVYAVDIANEMNATSKVPGNFQLVLSDGCSVPVPANSVDIAYSYQLMEHLHPADALEQLQNVYSALIPGGVYICITPNRLNGPHDISMYFDEIATGFHLKEYTTLELSELFTTAGFSRVRAYVGAKAIYKCISVSPIAFCEMLLAKLRYSHRVAVARSSPFRALLGIRLMAVK